MRKTAVQLGRRLFLCRRGHAFMLTRAGQSRRDLVLICSRCLTSHPVAL
jgi:hypothetical protein